MLKQQESDQVYIAKCSNEEEWIMARNFRQKYFFDPNNIDDPYQWTFNHSLHEHLVLYQNTEILGYAHIQLWPDERAAVRIIVIEEGRRNNSLGGKFLNLCERRLENQGYNSIHAESNAKALEFYKKNGYEEMPFNDPDDYEASPEDIAVGKKLYMQTTLINSS